MKWLYLAFACFGVISAAPQFNNNGISPAMRQVLLDMIKGMMQPGPSSFKVGAKPPMPPPLPFKPPSPAFLPIPSPPRPPTNGNNNGLLMDMPAAGGPGGGFGASPMHMARNYVYCPPGPTSNDACKDQKLQEALYFPDGTPRYNWVPPRNPWDTSIPDTVKDTAQNILMMKVNSRPNRTPTAKEWELMSLLGDPKEQGPAHSNPFAMGGGARPPTAG